MLSFKIRPNEEKVNICWTLTFPCCPELLNGRALDQHALASLWLEMLAGFLSWPLVRGSLLCSLSGRPRSKWEGLEWFEENNLNINLLTQLKYGCESWLIWWWTGRPGVLQFMGSQRVGHDWAELNWTHEEEIGFLLTVLYGIRAACTGCLFITIYFLAVLGLCWGTQALCGCTVTSLVAEYRL